MLCIAVRNTVRMALCIVCTQYAVDNSLYAMTVIGYPVT